jgi:hypothetical protein
MGAAQNGQSAMEVLMVWRQLGHGRTLMVGERLRAGDIVHAPLGVVTTIASGCCVAGAWLR